MKNSFVFSETKNAQLNQYQTQLRWYKNTKTEQATSNQQQTSPQENEPNNITPMAKEPSPYSLDWNDLHLASEVAAAHMIERTLKKALLPCTQTEFKKIYRKTMFLLHPDKGGCPEAFRQHLEAFQLLQRKLNSLKVNTAEDLATAA